MEVLEVLGISGGTALVAASILVYAGRRFFDHALEREMEKERHRREELEAERGRSHHERLARLQAELGKDTQTQLATLEAKLRAEESAKDRAHAEALEQLRSELAAQRDLAAAAANADLRVQAFQRETRFATLHARQAEAYIELSEKIRHLQDAVEALVNITQHHGPGEEAKREGERRQQEEVERQFRELSEYIGKKGLLFGPVLQGLLEAYGRQVRLLQIDWDTGDWDRPDRRKIRLKAYEKAKTLRTTVLRWMSEYMQATLGLEEPQLPPDLQALMDEPPVQ